MDSKHRVKQLNKCRNSHRNENTNLYARVCSGCDVGGCVRVSEVSRMSTSKFFLSLGLYPVNDANRMHRTDEVGNETEARHDRRCSGNSQQDVPAARRRSHRTGAVFLSKLKISCSFFLRA